MASQIINYKVFIASPGGLEAERKNFKSILSAHNETDAMERGCNFQSIGWEITLGGVGRPQARINQDLKTCDLFVLVLWDRWGSPTGAEEGYTSGTHEEYEVALECLKSNEKPMKDIVVFFKAVDPRRLSDPGPQLSSVLDFKRLLEKERSLLYETFDTPEAFSEKLRKHIAKWTRDHSGEANEEVIKEIIEIESDDKQTIEFIDAIKNRSGYTDTEAKLANDVIIKRDMQSFDRYGIFLSQEERYDDSITLYQQMHDLANDVGDLAWASTAIARIGGVYRSQGRPSEAIPILMNALRLKKDAGDEKGETSVNIWIGDLTFKQKKPDIALKHYTDALLLNIGFDDNRIASLKWKISKCYSELGNHETAKTFSDEAYKLYQLLGKKQEMQAIKQSRKARSRANKLLLQKTQ
jgi:tetratricopeptide (TPR) repeat protein